MLKDLSIKTKLAAGFGAIIAIILILLATSYVNFSKLSTASEWDRHTLHVLLEANQIETSLLQIQTSTRGFMLTGEESTTRPIPAEEEATRRHLAAITKLTSDNPAQQERLARLGPMMENWINNVIHPLLEKRRALNKQVGVSQQVATPADVLNGAKTIADVRALIHDLSAEEERLLAQRSQTSNDLQRTMAMLLIVGGGVCVVLALFVGYLLPSENVMQVLGPALALLSFAGGLFVPLDQMSDVFASVAAWTPAYGVGVLARAPFGDDGSILLAVVNVLAWAAVFVGGAAWAMSRDTKRV